MNSRRAASGIAAVLVLVGLAHAGEPPTDARAAAEPTWRAGVATVVVTPERPMWMSGYAARTKPAEGTLQDLKAKALVLEDPAGRRAVVVTADLLGFPRDLSVAVRDRLATELGFPRERVLLAASHTHSGPVVGKNLRPAYTLDAAQEALVREYAGRLEGRLVEVVGDAVAALAPADLSTGVGRAAFAVNRRNNREADVPELRAKGRLAGPVDHDVPVLAVRSKDGALRAALFGYACHATVLDGYDWSGDYPGFAQAALERDRPGATALFFAGCGGDQNPVPRRSAGLAERYGRALADAVGAVLDAPMRPVRGTLAAGYAEVPLAFAELPSRDRLEEQAAGADRFAAARARLLLEEIARNGSLRADYPYPVQAWRLGDGPTLVALGGEVVVDYALRLKSELGPERTWVAAYANDVMAYVPSRRILAEGGYEGGGAMVYYGLPSPWALGVEEAIVAAVHEQVRKLSAADAPAESPE